MGKKLFHGIITVEQARVKQISEGTTCGRGANRCKVIFSTEIVVAFQKTERAAQLSTPQIYPTIKDLIQSRLDEKIDLMQNNRDFL